MAIGSKGTEQFKTPIGTTISMDAPVFVPVGRGTVSQTLSAAKPTATNFVLDNLDDFNFSDLNGNTITRGPDINSALGLSTLVGARTSTGSTDLGAITSGQLASSDTPLDLTGVANQQITGIPSLTGEDETAITVTAQKPDDYRVRLSALTGTDTATQIYGPNDRSQNVLAILHETNGLLFPYTPTITQNQSVNWEAMSLVGANYDIHGYKGTPSVSLSVNAVFTAQNQREGEYCAAVLHFLRTVSKSYFGEEDRKEGLAGLPPPVLRFHGYGSLMFKNVYCVVKNWSYTFEDSVDMNLFTLPAHGHTAKIPAKFTISLDLGVQQNPAAQRDAFSLNKFRTGELLSSSSGWI